MASLFGRPFFLVCLVLEKNSDSHRNEGESVTIAVHAVVAGFDVRLEARAKWNLDPAANVPSEIVLGLATASANLRARTIETNAADRVRRERHSQWQLIRQIAGERRDVDATTAGALKTKLVVRCLCAHRHRQQLRLVSQYEGDVVAGIRPAPEITSREPNSAGSPDLEWIVTLSLRIRRSGGDSRNRGKRKNDLFHCCSVFVMSV